jgi:hypothetical protein
VPDDQTPDESTEPASAEPAPTEAEPAATTAEATSAEPTAADTTPAPTSTSTSSSAKGWIWGAAAVVVVIGLVVGAYFVGQSSVDEGPTSLADAAHQTAKGDLPVGDLSLDDITGALGKNAGGILGGKNSTGNDLVDGLLNKLGKEIQNKLEDGLNGLGYQLQRAGVPRRQQHQRARRCRCRSDRSQGRELRGRRGPAGG